MPFALVSLDFLRGKLHNVDISTKYNNEQQPSLFRRIIDPVEVVYLNGTLNES